MAVSVPSSSHPVAEAIRLVETHGSQSKALPVARARVAEFPSESPAGQFWAAVVKCLSKPAPPAKARPARNPFIRLVGDRHQCSGALQLHFRYADEGHLGEVLAELGRNARELSDLAPLQALQAVRVVDLLMAAAADEQLTALGGTLGDWRWRVHTGGEFSTADLLAPEAAKVSFAEVERHCPRHSSDRPPVHYAVVMAIDPNVLVYESSAS